MLKDRFRLDPSYFTPGPDGWERTRIYGPAELREVAAALERAMAAAGYCRRDCLGIHLALEEAVVNAIKHGHQGDTRKPVRVRYQVGPGEVLVEVEDQGEGFDPRQVPDPRTPENLERPSGRGLLLMRSFTTWMRHNEHGNRVTFCKCRTQA